MTTETDDSRDRVAAWLRRLSCEDPPNVAGQDFIDLSLTWADEVIALTPPAARPAEVGAEPTGELREQVAQWLQDNTLMRNGCYWYSSEPDLNRHADALLSGPLAPLLAKLRAVEALADEMAVPPHAANPLTPRLDAARRIRRALDAS